MPFTLAHPAAALLVRWAPLPVAAVVAGAMAPDVPVFLKEFGRPYDLTHSLTGVLTVDLVVSLVGLLVWFCVLRDPFVDLLPTAVRDRLEPHARYTRTQWLLAVPAAVVGSLTHVGWDLFTHHGRWGVEHVTWLQQTWRGHDRSVWAQYVSSVAGLLVCVLWAAVAVARRDRVPRAASVPTLGSRALGLVLVVTVSAGLAAGATAPRPGTLAFLGQTAVVGTMVFGIGLVVLTGVWHYRLRRA